MTRLLRTSAAALTTCLLLATTVACNDESPPPGGGKASSSDKAAPTAAYAVDIAFADVGAAGEPTALPPGQPVLMTVTNTGKKADAFLLQLRPPDGGAVTPAGVQLKPGTSADVRLLLLPPPPGQPSSGAGGVTLVAVSRTTHEVVGQLALPEVGPTAE